MQPHKVMLGQGIYELILTGKGHVWQGVKRGHSPASLCPVGTSPFPCILAACQWTVMIHHSTSIPCSLSTVQIQGRVLYKLPDSCIKWAGFLPNHMQMQAGCAGELILQCYGSRWLSEPASNGTILRDMSLDARASPEGVNSCNDNQLTHSSSDWSSHVLSYASHSITSAPWILSQINYLQPSLILESAFWKT